MFRIKLADLIIRIRTLYDDTLFMCREYLFEESGKSDLVVETSQADIDRERELDKLGDFGDGYYETLAVYRKIAEELPRFGRLLVHGSAVALGGRAFLFMAPSGTGKSTHARWWRTEFADEEPFMVNDDKPILRVTGEGASIYGTPWDGKERLSTNVCVPLAGIGLLERAEQDSAEPLDGSVAFTKLLSHSYRPVGAEAMRETLGALQRLSQQVPLWRVRVTNTGHAAHVTRAAMAGV